MINTNIEKSFYCIGESSNQCFGCSYCRAIDSCNKTIKYDLLSTQVNDIFNNVPVAINLFYGDPLIQMEKTINYLRQLELVNHKGIVIIITKGDFSKFPDIPFNLDLHIAFSTFGISHKYDGGSWERFTNNLNQIKKRKNNYKYSIEFRPICYGINDDYSTLEKVIKTAKEYSLPVSYSGLQGKPELVEYWKENNINLIPYPNFTFGHTKPISDEVETNIRDLANKYGVNLFHKTSCMLSYTHNLERDYNCHYYRPDEVKCELCPMNNKCNQYKEQLRDIYLPFDFNLEYKVNHECTLCKNGKCNTPCESCKKITGYVIKTKEPLTIADYRMIKWQTGYIVDNNFSYSEKLSDFWRN